MLNKGHIIALLGVLLAVPAFAQTASSTKAVPILQGAALPVYPPIAKAAHITGKVIVRTTVKDGTVIKTEVLSKAEVAKGERFLESATIENLKTWRFAANVTDVFTVTYTYEIIGTETDDPMNARIEMLPSLDVRITARPLKQTVMYEKHGNPSADTSSHESNHASPSIP